MDPSNNSCVSVHEGNQPSQCGKCDTCVSRILLFKKRLMKKHNKSLHEKIKLFDIEHIDDASFTLEYGKDGHISSIHETKKLFSCEICGVSFGHRSILKNHKVTVHEENNLMISVDESLMSVDEKSVHKGEKPFKCNICDYKFSTRKHITQHISSVHEGKKPFNCSICDYNCSRKERLTQHMASVHEGKKALK